MDNEQVLNTMKALWGQMSTLMSQLATAKADLQDANNNYNQLLGQHQRLQNTVTQATLNPQIQVNAPVSIRSVGGTSSSVNEARPKPTKAQLKPGIITKRGNKRSPTQLSKPLPSISIMGLTLKGNVPEALIGLSPASGLGKAETLGSGLGPLPGLA
ncbi:hypothetical protein M407DRAFT_29696 [Tulasnella calospora MUT 4182]|uniref:Uncharacterized protein n=1 Tax=Tulasnella calospora MUT 4182 TaxID=1051891 RepID=A0A0C3Q9M6_9AGAM|nr:hypothetical protein M407DRAFT_29696 [Tulasnella calospora MUT 4182]